MEPLPLSYYKSQLQDLLRCDLRQLDQRKTVELIGRMVFDGPDGATDLLVDALHGCYGGLVGALAYRALETGTSIGNANPLDDGNPMVASFAEVCMFKGRLAMLEAVLNVSPRDSSSETRSLSKSDYLDYLCSTAGGRERYPSAFEDGRMEGLVGLAARNWDICRYAKEALDMAYRLTPEHHAWEFYVDEASGPGAFVREYLMNRKLAATEPAALVTEEPGRRRAARAL